jgi:hypothetical protein
MTHHLSLVFVNANCESFLVVIKERVEQTATKGEVMTRIAARRLNEINDVAKELPESELSELLDFARFLRIKKGKPYGEVEDSAAFVRELRAKAGNESKSGESFIRDLIAWQESNS